MGRGLSSGAGSSLCHTLIFLLLNIRSEKAVINKNLCKTLKLSMYKAPIRAVRKRSIDVCIQDTTLISFGTLPSTIHTQLFVGFHGETPVLKTSLIRSTEASRNGSLCSLASCVNFKHDCASKRSKPDIYMCVLNKLAVILTCYIDY